MHRNFIAFVLLLATNICFANTIHVPGDSATIQAGIDGALEGDTVLVAQGLYKGPGNRDISFNGKGLSLISEAGPVLTIIDCEGDSVHPHQGFAFNHMEDSSSVIDGFTIRNGFGQYTEYYNDYAAGAILCDHASPKVLNCVFADNRGGYLGGAAACFASHPKFMNCTFVGNSAQHGSAVFSMVSMPRLENCLIAYCREGIPILAEADLRCCNIYGNEVGNWAGLIAGQFGQDGNISADPLLCDTSNNDFSISVLSPCSPYVNDSCGLIGALGPACDFDVPYAYKINYGIPPNSDTVFIAQPQISWTYIDTASTTQTAYEVEVGADEDWSLAEMWASGEVESGENHTLYSGLPLQDRTHYYLRIRVNNGSRWGAWQYSEFIAVLKHSFNVPTEFSAIQDAIDFAIRGDTIKVSDGIYTGDGNRDVDFHGKNILLTSENGPENTIIDCQGSQEDPHRAFLFDSGESHEAKVEGFKIINGCGAILCVQSSPTISQCILEDNFGAQRGGAVFCRESNINIIECEFRNNIAQQGACIYFDRADKAAIRNEVNIINCILENNSAISLTSESSCAGGIMIGSDSVTVTMEGCLFYNNVADVAGVISCVSGSTLNLLQCSIVGNKTNNDLSSAIFIYGSSLNIENSIIAFSKMGAAVSCGSEYTIDISCTNIYGNAGGDWVGGISQLKDANGNLRANPLFCNAATGELSLFSNSPCLPNNNSCGVQIGSEGEGCSAHNYETWIVEADRSGSAPTIQAAIDSSLDGDTVLVKDGTFTRDGNRDLDCWGKEIVITSENGPLNTIIDCQANYIDLHRAFRLSNAESNNLIIQGFTMQNGIGLTEGYGYEGGAIYLANSSPTIKDCILTNNRSYDGGGAISGFATNAIIENCRFSNNISDNAAAINYDGRYSWIASPDEPVHPQILDCTFFDNIAQNVEESAGGAIFIQYGQMNLSVQGCVFGRNQASHASAVGCRYASIDFTNCTFVGNQSVFGGGDVIFGHSHLGLELKNCILGFNGGSQAISCDEGTPPLVFYTDIYGNNGGNWVGCISELDGINGNISENPVFCNVSTYDYTISLLSPCAGTGENGSNMGALGIGCGIPCGDVTHDGVVDIGDAVYMINYIFVSGPQPDPFYTADANCDTYINLVDIIFVINYVFRGGNAPCDTNGDGEPDC